MTRNKYNHFFKTVYYREQNAFHNNNNNNNIMPHVRTTAAQTAIVSLHFVDCRSEVIKPYKKNIKLYHKLL